MNPKESILPKNYGDVDMVTFYAQLMFSQAHSMFYKTYRTEAEASNLFSQAQEILDALEETEEKLRGEEAYFYTDGSGSVFTDFKDAVDRAFPEDGSLSAWERENITLDMSSQEAFEVCKKQVEGWWE